MLQFSRFHFFSHCEINIAVVWNVEVIPVISTDPNPIPNPNPNHKLSLLVNGKKSETR